MRPFVLAVLLLACATPAHSQVATIDGAKFLDPRLPDCGLQKAIDSVPDGGLLVIPKGTYVLRRSLVLKANMTLSGVGDETVLTVMPLLPSTLLAAAADKGAATVTCVDASRFEPGMQVVVRDARHVGWWSSHAIVTAVKGNVLHLDRPLQKDYDPARQAYVGHLFPALYAKNQPKTTIQFLCITGPKVPTPFRDFVLSAIHLDDCSGSLITKCTALDWHSDGFSVQRGSGVRVMDNVARRNRGHGYHPGTGLEDSFWSGNLGEQNGDFGLFYCARVKRVVTSHNTFRWNARHGIGKLGDADDRDNLVLDNDLDGNGEAGVHVGWDKSLPAGAEKGSGNFVVGNRCAGNGKAAILLEYATNNVIARNQLAAGQSIVEGKDAAGNYLAANTDAEPAFPGPVPAERLKLLEELVERDAKNVREWAAIKKTLRAPK